MSTNVVLLTVDCLRYDRCGFNGYHGRTTPNLDDLAAQSYVFDDAHAPGTWTAESVPKTLAGLRAPDMAYYEDPELKSIPRDAPTLATWLREFGYATTAAVANPQLSPERNFDRGFDSFENLRLKRSDSRDDSARTHDRDNLADRAIATAGTYYSFDTFLARLRAQTHIANPYTAVYGLRQLSRFYGEWPAVRSETVIRGLWDRLRTLDSTDHPFFAWSHLMDLHPPLHPRSIERGGGPGLGRYLLGDAARASDLPSARYDRLYDSALRYTDAWIGRLVEKLRSRGLWDDTILILTADHGEAMGERGVHGHRNYYPYDELTQVPLLVRVPDGPGARIEAPFSLSWLHELLAELLDVPPARMPAGSPSGTHLNEPDDGRSVITDALGEWGQLVVVRNDEFELVRYFDERVPTDPERQYALMKHLGVDTPPTTETFEGLNAVYHLPSDPCESHPLALSAAPAELHRRADETHTTAAELSRLEGQVDPSVTEMLSDLGYR
jgi:arylsulfatase A-like enzyme